MIGWMVSIHRGSLGPDRTPVVNLNDSRWVATWECGGSQSLNWLLDLERDGHCHHLEGDGFKDKYALQAMYVTPLLLKGIPGTNIPWPTQLKNPEERTWFGKAEIDMDQVNQCRCTEWLEIFTLDLS